MTDDLLNIKRIRDSAPYRKSMSLTEIDLKRASELELIYNSRFPGEAPFNFSKTISKSIELAYLQILSPNPSEPIQRSLTGGNVDASSIKAKEEQRSQRIERENKTSVQPVSHKKFQKTKRGFH